MKDELSTTKDRLSGGLSHSFIFFFLFPGSGAIVHIGEPGPARAVGTASNIIRAVKERKRSDLGAVC